MNKAKGARVCKTLHLGGENVSFHKLFSYPALRCTAFGAAVVRTDRSVAGGFDIHAAGHCAVRFAVALAGFRRSRRKLFRFGYRHQSVERKARGNRRVCLGRFNQIGGPLPVQQETTFGDAKGTNGRYQIHIAESALMFSVRGTWKTQYHGQTYTVNLWPTDNKRDGTGEGDFRGHTTKGIARDFMLKLSVLRPGYTAAKYPDNSSNGDDSSSSAYYGGTVNLNGTWTANYLTDRVGSTELTSTLPKDSTITVTFTPSTPLLDGTTGVVLQRRVKLGPSMYLFGIPFGLYPVSASATDPSGGVHPLRIRNTLPTDNRGDWGTAASLEWHPLKTAFDDTGSVIIREILYLVE